MSGIGLGLDVAAIGARLAGITGCFSGVTALLKRIPKRVWEALAVAAYALALLALHQHQVRTHDAALIKVTIARRDGEWRGALAKAHVAAISKRAAQEAAAVTISSTIKGQHDAQVRSNASDAGALRLRGAGKAAAAYCGPVDHPGFPAAAGRPDDAAGGTGTPAGQMPAGDGLSSVQQAPGRTLHDPDLATVPWGWLVDQAQEHDDAIAENAAWRSWYAQQRASWDKFRNAKP